MLRAVTYCRCSTEEESQQDALRKQVAESRQSALNQGWALVDEYIEAKSGTTTARRNEYNRLYEELQSDKFDIVIIKSIDRLMRNTKDWYLFLDRMVTNGKRLYMYLEKKFYSADDALIIGIKAILAEEYSKELSKKINNAHQHRQREGRSFILPSQTYGLERNEDGTISIVEEEAAAIKIMFFLCKQMGCVSIGHYLAENGIHDRYGKAYKEEAIRRIIRNPVRYGTIVQNKKHFDFQLKKTVNVPEENWVIHENAVPAIVSKQEWLDANAAMDERAENRNLKECHPRGKNPGKYQLSGKIRCGECGSPYYRRYRKRYKDKQMIVEWKCRRYIQNGRNRAELRKEKMRKTGMAPGQGCDNIHLDEEKLVQLLEKISRQYYDKAGMDYAGIVNKMMEVLKEVLEENDSGTHLKQLQREKLRYEDRRKKLLEKLLDEVITDQDYKEKRKEIDNKLELLKQDVTHLNNDENAQIVLEQRLAAIQKRLEEGVVKQASITEMVEGIESIIVFPDRLVIRYKPDKVFGTGGPVLDSIDNMDGKMQRKLQTEVKLDDDFLYGTRKEAQNVRIMDYMRENPKITARMIAEKEKISLSAANAKIKRLRTKGKIHFRGAGGHGEWIVNEDNEE